MLIPKVKSPEHISQFRPIGLCTVLYKILTKTIVNRLCPLMEKVTRQNQSSFIPGGDITDNIIIAQEVFHSLKRFYGSKYRMVLKIDLEKAYNKIRWDFLHDTLLEIELLV